MAHILKDLFEPYFRDLAIFRPGRRGGVPVGEMYELDPEAGDGWYWIYPVGKECAVTLNQLRLRHDLAYHQHHPPFLFFGMLEGDMAYEDMGVCGCGGPGRRVAGYAGDSGESRMLLPRDRMVASVGLTVTREFCEAKIGRVDGVGRGESSGFARLKRVLEGLGRSPGPPELVHAFQQLRAYRPERSVAGMYYEGKVMEILAYALQWGDAALMEGQDPIPADDAERLRRVERHLREHHAVPGRLEDLAAMACMSRTKLLALFKRVYGRTITQHVQAARMDRARMLLLHSDLKIEAIAAEVGYRRHGSFSELFKRRIGVTPAQFRLGAAGRLPEGRG